MQRLLEGRDGRARGSPEVRYQREKSPHTSTLSSERAEDEDGRSRAVSQN